MNKNRANNDVPETTRLVDTIEEPRNLEKRFVIQRASETACEWWTGTGWSENWGDALRYKDEPDAGQETGDESAKVLLPDASNVTKSGVSVS